MEEKGESRGAVPVGDILFAAKSGNRVFSNLLHHNRDRLSRNQLEKALRESLNYPDFNAATVVLLDNGVDPNGYTLDEDKRPLLAAARIDVTYSQLLINKGASVDIPGLLTVVVEEDNFELLNLLIAEDVDLETHGPEALAHAMYDDNFEIAAVLLDSGTDVNVFGLNLTALQIAAGLGNIHLAEYLMEKGANVNIPASSLRGRTALQKAAECGQTNMVAFLLDNHANVNAPRALAEGRTALEACVSGWMTKDVRGEIFKLLVDNGASVNHPAGAGYENTTILHELITGDEGDLIRLTLEAGVNVNHMSSGKEGRTPLQLAAEKGNLEVSKLLIEHGAEVNASPGYKHGRTALQAAASCKPLQMDLVQLLLDNQANVNAPAGVTGEITALQGAAISGHINMARMLIERGADVNTRTAFKDGRTAVEGAAEHGRLDMVQLLLNAGERGIVAGKIFFKKDIYLAEKNRHFAVAKLLRNHETSGGEKSISDL